jgi:acyl carrier protein
VTTADAVIDELARVCALTTAQVRREAMLIELGLDSIRGVEFLIALESHFGIELADDAIATVMTVEDVILMVEQQVDGSPRDADPGVQGNGRNTRLR